jgi:hypothetical protein
MIPPGPLFHKPKSILASRNILYATLFLGVLGSAIGEFSAGMHSYSNPLAISTTIISFVLQLVIIRQIGFGHKWARTVLLILFILGMLATPLYVPFLFKTSLALGFLFALQMILQIMALVFLFSKNSNVWFNRVKTDPA